MLRKWFQHAADRIRHLELTCANLASAKAIAEADRDRWRLIAEEGRVRYLKLLAAIAGAAQRGFDSGIG